MDEDDATQASETFRRVTRRFGEPLQRDLMSEPTRAAYDEVANEANDLIQQARNALPGLPQIHFDFILSSNVNAVAFAAEGEYFIGINTGTLFMLRLVIGRMLSDSRAFPSIGDPALESSDLPPFTHYRPHADSMAEENELLFPNDPVRRSFADFVQTQAILFFIGHEIAHISRGHVAYLRERRQVAQSEEISSVPITDGELKIERQSIEQDADRRSIQARVHSLKNTHRNPAYAPPPWAMDDGRFLRLFQDWAISMSVAFRLYGDVRFTGLSLDNAAYPPLALRRLYGEMVAAREVEQAMGIGLQDGLMDALNGARNETEEAFALILGEPISMTGFLDAMSPAGREHAFKLQQYWNERMVERLKPFSYEF
jgi:hypothetical protein